MNVKQALAIDGYFHFKMGLITSKRTKSSAAKCVLTFKEKLEPARAKADPSRMKAASDARARKPLDLRSSTALPHAAATGALSQVPKS